MPAAVVQLKRRPLVISSYAFRQVARGGSCVWHDGGSNVSSNGDTSKGERNHAAECRELRKHVKINGSLQRESYLHCKYRENALEVRERCLSAE